MDEHEALKRLSDDFRQFLDWYKAVHLPDIRKKLGDELDSIPRRIVYQLTEAERSSREIAEVTEAKGHSVAASTIRVWQQEWARLGIVRQVSAYKRERVFDLEELGVDIGVDLSEWVG